MKKVGITGGIGSGKTTVCKIFEMLGTPVFYADDEAKKLYDSNQELKALIIQHFGNQVYRDGVFDRREMRAIVFNDSEKRKLLNSMVHPIVKTLTEKWFSIQTTPYAIKEAALLIESGSYKDLDEIIFVDSPLSLRVERVMQRDHLSEDEVMDRIQAQMPDQEKKKFATRVITNDAQHLLIPQVVALHNDLMQRNR